MEDAMVHSLLGFLLKPVGVTMNRLDFVMRARCQLYNEINTVDTCSIVPKSITARS